MITFLLCGLQVSYVLGFFSLFAIGTYGFTLNEAFLVSVIGYAAIQVLWYGKPLRIPLRIEVIATGALWVAFAISTVVVTLSGQREFMIQSIKTLAHFTLLWAAAMALICMPITEKQWVAALRTNLVVAAVIGLYAVYQVPARALQLPLAWIEISNASFARGVADGADTNQLSLQFANFFRATSVFSEPSALAAYASSSVLLLIVPLLRGSATVFTSRTATWIVVCILLLALLLAFSLTGVMVIAASAVLAAVLFGKRTFKPMLYTTLIAAVILVLANSAVLAFTEFNVLETFGARITSVVSGSAASELSDDNMLGESYTQRESDYALSYEVWKEHPVTGVGPGCFSLSEIGKTYSSPFVSTSYGSVMAELGTVGLIALVGMFVILFTGFVRDYLRWNRLTAPIGKACEGFAPYIPFKMLQVILVSLTGNSLISASLWTDLGVVIGCQTRVRMAVGHHHEREVFALEKPLREHVIVWLRKGARVGTDY